MNTTDTVKAKLTPGEFVIRKEAVDMIGVPMLEKLNGMPEEGGGHSAIDRIIQMATLQNMQPMYSGGEVTTDYASDMQGYENGGGVEDQLMSIINMGNQAQAKQDSLKQVYSQPMDRFQEDGNLTREFLLKKLGLPQETAIDTLYNSGNGIGLQLNTPEGSSYKYNRRGSMTDKSQEYGEKADAVKSDLRSQIMGGRKKFESDHPDANKALLYDIVSGKYGKALSKAKAGYVDMNPFERMDYDMESRGFQTGGLLGMANGGEVPGYQDGGQPQQDDAMMQQYSQQQQPSNIAPPGAAAGGTMSWGAPGAYMQSIMAERDSLDMQDKEMVRQKAINAIQRLRLDALSGQSMQNDDMEISSDAMERHYSRPSPMETSQSRNESEYLKHQMLQRSPESVLQGIMQPNDTRGMYR